MAGPRHDSRRVSRSSLLRWVARSRHLFVAYLGLVLLLLLSLVPIAWMLSTALKPAGEVLATPPRWIPDRPSFDSFVQAWQNQAFARYFLNSSILAVSTTVLCVLLASLAGYGMSRYTNRALRFMATVLVIAQMVPGVLLVIPYYQEAVALRILNTYLALVLAYTSFALPFSAWMLKGFLDSIPPDLDEAAMIDGCGRLSALVRVVLPLAVPGIVATATYAFVLSWSEFLFGFVLTVSSNMYPVTVAVVSNIGSMTIQWNELMAGALIAAAPAMLVYGFLERYLVAGLSGGAVKG